MTTPILYLKDYAATDNSTDYLPQFNGFSNGLNATSGFDSMVAAVTAALATAEWHFTTALSIGGCALGNHNLFANGGSEHCSIAWSNDSGANWTSYGDDILSNDDLVVDFASWLTTPALWWRVSLTGMTVGKKIGCISLLSNNAYHRLVMADMNCPRFPIGQVYDAVNSDQITATGDRIRQRRGGAFSRLQFDLKYVVRDGTAGGLENLYQSFMNEMNGVQGLSEPIWVVDDNANAYHGYVMLPMQAPITTAGGRQELSLVLQTCPHFGLT